MEYILCNVELDSAATAAASGAVTALLLQDEVLGSSQSPGSGLPPPIGSLCWGFLRVGPRTNERRGSRASEPAEEGREKSGTRGSHATSTLLLNPRKRPGATTG